MAEDGTIEAVFGAGTPGFVMGLQWHPEWRYLEHPASIAIFRAFGEACRARQDRLDVVRRVANVPTADVRRTSGVLYVSG